MSGSSPTTGTKKKNRVATMVTRFFLYFQTVQSFFQRSIIEQSENAKVHKIKNRESKC
nr:MAG TPA: hypothetical protein [Caudoviricetes sp.]